MTSGWRTWAAATGCVVAALAAPALREPGLIQRALSALAPRVAARQAPFDPVSPSAPVVRLSVPGRVNAVPSMAARGAFVAVAWAATAGSRVDAFVAVSRDGGRSFGAPVRANDVTGTVRAATESGPRVALGPPAAGKTDPEIVVVWTGREPASTIRRTRSVDGGRTFEPSAALQGAGAPGSRGWASLSVNEPGEVRVAWLDHRGTPTASAGAHQHGVAPAAGGDHQHAGSARAVDGKTVDAAAVAATMVKAQQSGFYLSSGSGPARELARGVCYCCKTALASGPGGLVAAAWRHVYAGNLRDMAFITSRDGGRTFSAPVRVSADGWAIDGCPEDGPSVVIDATGVVHLAWPTVVKGSAEYKAIFYASSTDGVIVSPRVQVSPRNRSVAHPQILLNAAGAPVLLWDSTGPDRGVWMATRQPDGRFASPARVRAAVDASYPVAAVSGTEMLVAWLEQESASPTVRVQRLR